jgi:hypothetical protein
MATEEITTRMAKAMRRERMTTMVKLVGTVITTTITKNCMIKLDMKDSNCLRGSILLISEQELEAGIRFSGLMHFVSIRRIYRKRVTKSS